MGDRLKERIISTVARANDKHSSALKQAGFDPGILKEFVDAFRESGQESIDAFLAHRPGFLEVGKAAIAAVMILYETPGALSNPPDRTDHWYSYLWGVLQDGGAGAFGENALTVVTFNYDRSLERFLISAFANSFGVDLEEAAEVIRASIPIVHVHGRLGALSDAVAGDRERPYEISLDPVALKVAASQIIVLPEADDTSPEFKEAARMIRDARHVVFLGCKFHDPNMRRLHMPNPAGHSVHPCWLGSGYGMTVGEMDVVRRRRGIQVLAEKNLGLLRATVALQPDLYSDGRGHPAIPWPPSNPYQP
ncbi:MAG: SIR2 family protein [Gemmatimonadetes bacterium]|nr:SIR2 family protein [Gemmatimonadota bacterium]